MKVAVLLMLARVRDKCCSTIGLALIGALLLWAALPPLDWWPLAWIAPVPWVVLIRRDRLAGRRPYAVLALAGFCFWMAALHWLRLPHPATSIGWVALSFYFAFYLPVFVGLARVAVHRLRIPVILAAPIVWTGLELARAHLLTGMTMGSLGHTQYRWIGLIQLSDLTGAYGVSFVVMFVAASLARMVPCQRCRWALWPLAPAAALLTAVMLYGQIRINAHSGNDGPRIALIQGSIDIQMQYDPRGNVRQQIFDEYYALSKEAIATDNDIDLIVWPESMFRNSLVTLADDIEPPEWFDGTADELRQELSEAAEASLSSMAQTARWLDAPMLLGVDTQHFGPNGQQCFNSAAYVARDGRLLGRYDKMHLVMFGEYVPFANRFPWLQRLTPLPVSATAGDRPAAFELDGVRIAPNICYESVLPHVIRRQVNILAAEGKEPDVLVNLTNDGWFWGSSELDMHLICGVFRAVECRKPFLIAANTGFSAWIDADGRVLKQGKRRAKDVLITQTRVDRDRRSWYLAHGDRFAGVCLVVCGLCGLVGIFGRKRDSGTKRRTGGHVVDANPAVDGTARGP